MLALPVLVAWAGGLIAAADRGESPSPWLLPLMTLWANLHGGFVFGLVLIVPIALEAVLGTPRRGAQILGAALDGVCLCCAVGELHHALWLEYAPGLGKDSQLGEALPLITEWHPASFGHLGAFEICLLLALGLALWRGVVLPPLRIVLLLGLLHMALSAARNLEVLALVAPIVLAVPLAGQIGGPDDAREPPRPTLPYVAAAFWTYTATLLMASLGHYAPTDRHSPVAAVAELKRLHVSRVFNDYDFGGYLIANDVPTFIDGRTELYGEKFVVDQSPREPIDRAGQFFTMLE